MCLACSFPSAEGHWSEVGLGGAPGRFCEDRALDMLGRLLAPYGLSIRRATPGAGYLLTTPSGRAARAWTADEIWPAVAQLTGHTIDPLRIRLPPSGRDGSQ